MKKVHHPFYGEGEITTVKEKNIIVYFSQADAAQEFTKDGIQIGYEHLGVILSDEPCKPIKTVITKPINTIEDTVLFNETALLKALEAFAVLFKIYIEYKKKYHTKYLHNFYYIHIDDVITIRKTKPSKKYLFSFHTEELTNRFLAENFELIQNIKPLYQ